LLDISNEKEVNPTFNDALKHYLDTGSSISDAKHYPLMDLVPSLEKASEDMSFVFISGPSWSGKTQSIYVLDRFSEHPMWLNSLKPSSEPKFYCVLHFVLQPTVNQDIYKAVGPISELLRDAITNDFQNIPYYLVEKLLCFNDFEIDSKFGALITYCKFDKDHIKSLKTANVKKALLKYFKAGLKPSILISTEFIEFYSKIVPWETLAVISELINKRTRNKSLGSAFPSASISPLFVKDFNNELEPVKKPVLVCLDEFTLKDEMGDDLRNTFLRNLIRFVPKLVPILLGTNAKVANMISPISSNLEGSRGGS
jgi:hypothetical protein